MRWKGRKGPGSAAHVRRISVEAFFAYKTGQVGVAARRTNLRAGLRERQVTRKNRPGEAPTANTDSVAITLDTKDSLTFGEGEQPDRTAGALRFPGHRVARDGDRPARGKDANSGRVDLMVTIAAKLGDVFGAIVEEGAASRFAGKAAGAGSKCCPSRRSPRACGWTRHRQWGRLPPLQRGKNERIRRRARS